MPYQLDHRNPWIQRSNDSVIFPLGSWEASLNVQLKVSLLVAAFFSLSLFLFFCVFFLSCSNCEQPLIRAWLELTGAKSQRRVLTAFTERQINGEKGHTHWVAFYNQGAVTDAHWYECSFAKNKYRKITQLFIHARLPCCWGLNNNSFKSKAHRPCFLTHFPSKQPNYTSTAVYLQELSCVL